MILLDTHIVVWLAGDELRISHKAKAAIDEARQTDRGLAISDFTIYELSTLYRKKEIGLAISLESFLYEVEARFVILPITAHISASAFYLPIGYPKDAADRIIGATALVEGLTLITADAQIRKSQVPTVW